MAVRTGNGSRSKRLTGYVAGIFVLSACGLSQNDLASTWFLDEAVINGNSVNIEHVISAPERLDRVVSSLSAEYSPDTVPKSVRLIRMVLGKAVQHQRLTLSLADQRAAPPLTSVGTMWPPQDPWLMPVACLECRWTVTVSTTFP